MQGPFWLPWRIAFVGQENQIEDVHLLFPLFYLRLRCGRQNANTMLPLQLPMKFGNIVRVETSKIFDKDHDTADMAKVLAAKHTASL